MSRKYQGRHRALPVSPLQSARVALPALAAASLTVAAAGTAAATDVGQQTRANASAGFQDTTQWSQSSTGASRSMQRASVTKAKANAAAKAKNRAASAQQARVARDGQTRRAALGALAANDTSATTYTKPKPKPKPQTRQYTQSAPTQQNAPTARGSKVRADSTVRTTDQTRSSSRSSVRASDSSSQSTSSGWVRPIAGGTFTSGYGYRWGKMHSGVDFAAPVGTSLYAMNSGTVTAAGWYGGQGKRLVIQFDNGAEAHYAHMSSFAVSPGQRVGAGQVIGASGNTGNSTGPHLHLEIHVGGSPINPSGWLAARGLM